MYLGEDWTSRQLRKTLTEEYPYLLPRTMTSDEVHPDYDYQYINGEYDLPEGWMQLFLQCCKDIKEPLEKVGYLNKFRFLQIKEKWGRMELYCHGATDEVLRIIDKYRFLSQQVCSICGKPANVMTYGYVCPYCNRCVMDSDMYVDEAEIIEIKTSYTQDTFGIDGHKEEFVDCKDEWGRYLDRIGYVTTETVC